jgi:hypothetical protein
MSSPGYEKDTPVRTLSKLESLIFSRHGRHSPIEGLKSGLTIPQITSELLGNIADGSHEVAASRTQPREDKIAIVVYRATRLKKSFFDQFGEANFNFIGSVSDDLNALVTWEHRKGASL